MSEDSIERDGIKWGAEIAVDGVRPEWLGEDTYVDVLANNGRRWYSEGAIGLGVGAVHIGWRYVKAIRLPADHPHYQKQANPNLAMMHLQTQKPVVAVDWSKPIEAVHESNTVRRATAGFLGGKPVVHIHGIGDNWYVQGNEVGGTKWTIRNVQTPTPAIDPALVERMVTLVRGMREATKDNHTGKYAVAHNAYREARDIMDIIEPEVPEKIDEDLLTAREIALRYSLPAQLSSLSSYNTNQGKFDDHQVMHALQAAIRRGRALERGE